MVFAAIFCLEMLSGETRIAIAFPDPIVEETFQRDIFISTTTSPATVTASEHVVYF